MSLISLLCCTVFLLFIVNFNLLKAKIVMNYLKPDDVGWYILGKNKVYGPYNSKKIAHLYYIGKINSQHLVKSFDGRKCGSVSWVLSNELK